jgi:hypothetical protein
LPDETPLEFVPTRRRPYVNDNSDPTKRRHYFELCVLWEWITESGEAHFPATFNPMAKHSAGLSHCLGRFLNTYSPIAMRRITLINPPMLNCGRRIGVPQASKTTIY